MTHLAILTAALTQTIKSASVSPLLESYGSNGVAAASTILKSQSLSQPGEHKFQRASETSLAEVPSDDDDDDASSIAAEDDILRESHSTQNVALASAVIHSNSKDLPAAAPTAFDGSKPKPPARVSSAPTLLKKHKVVDDFKSNEDRANWLAEKAKQGMRISNC